VANQQHEQLTGSLQENALTLLCFSESYCGLARSTLLPELFSTFLFRDVATRAVDYIDQFKKPPREHLPDICEDMLNVEDQDRAKNARALLRSIAALGETLNEEYVVSQLEKFTRTQSLKLGVVEAAEAISQGDVDRAEIAVLTAVRRRISVLNPGLSITEVYQNLKRREDERERVALGIPELDAYGYGPTRKELFLIQAPWKRGKTWALIHTAKQALVQRWRVLCITLEVGADIYGRRLLQSMFGLTKRQVELDGVAIPVMDADENGLLTGFRLTQRTFPSLENARDMRKVGRKLNQMHTKQNLLIREFPTRQLTFIGLRAFLDSLEATHHFTPDLLIVDYPELMTLNVQNYRLELGALYADLRGIGVERNMAVAVASQVNREGAQVKQSSEIHAAEDVSKWGTVDQGITYNQTDSEKELHIARLFTAAGRNDKSRFTVLISQAYEIGQFVLQSRMMAPNYWLILDDSWKKNAQRNRTQDHRSETAATDVETHRPRNTSEGN